MEKVTILIALCFFLVQASPFKDSSPRIYQGQLAGEHEFPWAARLLKSNPFSGSISYCTCSLVTPNYLLTAGHCIYDNGMKRPALPMLVHGLIGNADVYNAKKIQFEKIWLHPEYDPSTIANDIAIIKTTEPLDLSDPGIGTICVAASNFKFKDEQEVTSVGWGLNAPGDLDDELRKTDSILINDNKKCKGWSILDMMRCIDSKTENQLCGGDSGGPLMVKSGDRYVLVGVASLSSEGKCRHAARISMCTMVTYYQPWITKIIGDDSLCLTSS